jgi:hypothetical protein
VGHLGAGETCRTVIFYFGISNILMPRLVNRIVSLGCAKRQLATENPKDSDILPVEDVVWNKSVSFLGTIENSKY